MDIQSKNEINIPEFEEIKKQFLIDVKTKVLPYLSIHTKEEHTQLSYYIYEAKEGNLWAMNPLRRLHNEAFPIDNMEEIEQAYKANHRPGWGEDSSWYYS